MRGREGKAIWKGKTFDDNCPVVAGPALGQRGVGHRPRGRRLHHQDGLFILSVRRRTEEDAFPFSVKKDFNFVEIPSQWSRKKVPEQRKKSRRS